MPSSPPSHRGLWPNSSRVFEYYSNGDAIPKDPVEAYAWTSIAAAQGEAIAKENKSKLAKRMGVTLELTREPR